MTSAASSVVLVEVLEGGVAVVTLNRPAVRNAIDGAVTQGLDRAVARVEADDGVQVAVLTGAGIDFCAGADLRAVAEGRGGDALRTATGGFAGFVDAPRKKPWIAAVNGRALAGGCELMLACDLIVASTESRFGLPEVQRGLAAVAGGLTRLPRALPPAIALEVILTGQPIDAARAAHHGLVNRVVPADRVLEEALALARAIAANAPLSVRESLRIARAAIQPAEDKLRAINREGWERIAHSADALEGARAFAEKRPPRWTGR